jgi:hypothetical protein
MISLNAITRIYSEGRFMARTTYLVVLVILGITMGTILDQGIEGPANAVFHVLDMIPWP